MFQEIIIFARYIDPGLGAHDFRPETWARFSVWGLVFRV